MCWVNAVHLMKLYAFADGFYVNIYITLQSKILSIKVINKPEQGLTVCSVQCTVSVYSVHCTVHSLQCTVYSVQCKVYIIRCTVYSVKCTVYSVQCTVYSVQFTVYSVNCTLYTVHCTLYRLLSTVYSVQRFISPEFCVSKLVNHLLN